MSDRRLRGVVRALRRRLVAIGASSAVSWGLAAAAVFLLLAAWLDLLWDLSPHARTAAAALAPATDSGMSWGPLTAPQANTPGAEVRVGSSRSGSTKPNSFCCKPRVRSRGCAASAGLNPAESTTRSNSSRLCSRLSRS